MHDTFHLSTNMHPEICAFVSLFAHCSRDVSGTYIKQKQKAKWDLWRVHVGLKQSISSDLSLPI